MEEIEIKGEKISLVKTKSGLWKVVRPFKIDGKINWLNLIAGGSIFNLIRIIIIVVLMILAILEFAHNTQVAQTCLDTLNKTKIDISSFIK